MTGTTNRHNQIAGNCFLAFALTLKEKPCQPHIFDTKLRVLNEKSKRFYYPDIQIVCEPNLPSESFHDRPALVVEVLSPSTRLYDLDEKLTAYTQIPTLKYYLILEQHQPSAILLRRKDTLFERLEFHGFEAVIDLHMLSVCIAMSDIYNGVNFTSTSVQENDSIYEHATSRGA